jgi:hypothetical protein
MLEVRFVRGAAGPTSFLTKREWPRALALAKDTGSLYQGRIPGKISFIEPDSLDGERYFTAKMT